MTETSSVTTPLHDLIADIVQRFRGDNSGDVATYIPELGLADPNWFGVCLVTVDGAVYEAGDSRQEFTIQSICKPFAFQMALEEHGRDHTLAHVGVEPSGDAFNSIELDPRTLRPFNPMINAGAIAVAAARMNDRSAEPSGPCGVGTHR